MNVTHPSSTPGFAHVMRAIPLACALAFVPIYSVAAALPVLPARCEGAPCAYRDTSLAPEARAKDLVSRMTLEEKAAQMQEGAPAIERLGLKKYGWWNEVLHGVARAGNATVFPQAIGLAATWNTVLMDRIGDTIALEGRANFRSRRATASMSTSRRSTWKTPICRRFATPSSTPRPIR